jgi:glyoxylase-like metal-dependent hydrolase (beta-lactamase superfamily II)
MKVEQIYTKCLSQGSYYIECNKEVAIIDPIREVETYVEKAKKSGCKIKYIFETHIHADFISGHLNLAKRQVQKLFMDQNLKLLSIKQQMQKTMKNLN